MFPRDWSHLRDTARYQVFKLHEQWEVLIPTEQYSELTSVICTVQATSLVGNWNEERELKRSVLKDLLTRKMTGSLKLDA